MEMTEDQPNTSVYHHHVCMYVTALDRLQSSQQNKYSDREVSFLVFQW